MLRAIILGIAVLVVFFDGLSRPTIAAVPVTFTSIAAGDWSTAATWSAVPSGDHAFPVDGDTAIVNHSLSLSANHAADSLTLQNFATLALGVHTLVIDSASDWSSGSISGGMLDQRGTLTLSSTNAKMLLLSTLGNAGTLSLTNTGNLQLSAGSTLRNGVGMGSTAVFDIASDADITGSAGGSGNPPVIDNRAALRKSAGGGTTTISVDMVNQNGAVIEAQSGLLQLAGTTLTNNGGTVFANGGNVQFAGGINVIGGTLTRAGGSLFDLSNVSVTLTGPTNAGYLRINPNTGATISGTFLQNNGTLEMGADANASAVLQLATDFVFSGTGDIYMSDSVATLNTTGPAVLTNAIGHTIHGRGTIDARLNNAGDVISDHSTLTLGATPKSNTGTFAAASTKTLVVNNVPVNNVGGTIRAADSGMVQINGANARVLGGTLQTLGTGVILFQNSQLEEITNLGLLRVQPNTTVNVFGSTLINSGTIDVGATANAGTILHFNTDVALVGTGDIFLSDTVSQLNSAVAATLTVPATQEIHGRGLINVGMVNAGTIRTELGTLTLAGAMKTNTGTMKAEGGFVLESKVPIENVGGLILARDASLVYLNGTGASIHGGTLQTEGTGLVQGANCSITDMNNLGQFRVQPNTTVSLSGSTLTNNGTIDVGATVNAGTILHFNNDMALAGTGDLFLSDTVSQLNSAAAVNLTVPATQDIHGRGLINVGVVNAGTIRSELGTLTLAALPKTNTGVMKAEGGFTLETKVPIENAGGLILARDASMVYLNGTGASIHGGTIKTEGSGLVQGANSGMTDVTNLGQFRVQPNTTVDVFGSTLTNSGTIEVGAAANASATLQFNTDLALVGTGDIYLSDSNAFLSTSGAARLTIPATQDIHGRGNVQAAVNNAGTIRAETGELVLHTNAKNNTGTMAAESGRSLCVNSAINNTGGLIVARDAAVVHLNGAGAFIQGGTLLSEGSGLVQASNNSLTDVSILGNFRVLSNTTVDVSGSTLTNSGTIEVGTGANAGATLQFNTDLALVGTGDIFLSDSNAFLSTSGAARLTIPATQDIHGRGNVQALVNNAGTIRAETGLLALHSNPKNNTGTMAAESGNTLRVDSAINNTGGIIVARDTSVVSLNGAGATIRGGTLQTEGTGMVQAANNTMSDVTNAGFLLVSSNTTTSIGGSNLVNQGRFQLGTNANASGSLQFVGSVVVSGTGEFFLSDSNSYLHSVPGALPVFGPGQVIHGRANLTSAGLNLGSIVGDHPDQVLVINPTTSPGLFNGGHIHVSGPQNMTINTAANFTNVGDVQIDVGRVLTVNNGPYRTVGGNTMVAGALQAAGGVALLGGTISGTGTVTGTVNNDGGTIAPGASAGTLNVTGAYAQSAAGELFIEIGGANAGEFDTLAMTGTADLCGGTLTIDVINGFAPTAGQTFVILTAPTVQGAFDSVVQDCTSGTLFNVTVNTNNVTLTAAAGACGNRIVSSIAPNGSVDARRAALPSGTGSFGPTSVAITFASAPGALTAADFAVSASNGAAPTISTVNVAGNVATVTFSGIIPQNSWTTVRHIASNTATTIGFRPGDVNADGSTNTIDPAILALGLGGHLTPALSQRSCDINRSTVCTAEDLTQAIDLLNGADGFSPQNGVTHPTCNVP